MTNDTEERKNVKKNEQRKERKYRKETNSWPHKMRVSEKYL